MIMIVTIINLTKQKSKFKEFFRFNFKKSNTELKSKIIKNLIQKKKDKKFYLNIIYLKIEIIVKNLVFRIKYMKKV